MSDRGTEVKSVTEWDERVEEGGMSRMGGRRRGGSDVTLPGLNESPGTLSREDTRLL